jgi:hypothetical protein
MVWLGRRPTVSIGDHEGVPKSPLSMDDEGHNLGTLCYLPLPLGSARADTDLGEDGCCPPQGGGCAWGGCQ